MGRTLLYIGLALAALWLVLQVAEVAVGGLLWLILIAAVVMVIIGVVQSMRSKGSGPPRSGARTPV